MTRDLEDDFYKIAQDAIRSAERIACPLTSFALGLDVIIEELRARRSAVEDEIRENDAREAKESDEEGTN